MNLKSVVAPDMSAVRCSTTSFRANPLTHSEPVTRKQVQTQRPPQTENDDSFAKPPLPTTFSGLGGFDYLMQPISDCVVSALVRPEMFRRFGAEPPTGVLLTGPTGVGKTALASAIYHLVAEQLGAECSAVSTYSTISSYKQRSEALEFLPVVATELISSKTGESEQLINRLFAEAIQKQPAIIFIDQLDIIAVKNDQSSREFERRVATALAAAMDSLRGQKVVVLGATSRISQMEAALRRPGRFDAELEIRVPNREQRTEIIVKFAPQLSAADVQEVAALTPGYVPADFHQLLREAALDAFANNQDTLLADNFRKAVKKVQPTAKREGFATVPMFSLDQIGGLESVKKLLNDHVLRPIKQPNLYKKLGLHTSTGIILYGAPGNGKSLLGRAVASQAECNFISIKGPELLNQYVGESERAVRTLFERARAARPVVLFLDECECLCRQRGGSQSDVTDRVVNQFLTELDGVGSDREGVFVIAATNRIDLLDKAIMRPGRLEKAVYVPLPNWAERADILEKQTRECSIMISKQFFQNLSGLEGFSGADLQAVVREAGLACVDRGGQSISEDDFKLAVTKVKRSVSDTDLAYYLKQQEDRE